MSEHRYVSVSLSGGKDSTAMLLMMLDRGERVDEAVFFDTGWEFPAMYDHIEKLRSDTGVNIVTLRPDKPFDAYMLTHQKARGNSTDVRGYGWPRVWARWCTRLKMNELDRHFRQLGGMTQCVGIAADEARRCADGKRYPLVEWGVTEADALAYCKARGYDWGGLYDHFSRVSCWCCPLKSLDEFRKLRHHFPDLWERLRIMDSLAWNGFTARATTEDLERRFSAEDRQMSFDFGGAV